MNPENIQLAINEILGALIHMGSSASSQISLGMGLF